MRQHFVEGTRSFLASTGSYLLACGLLVCLGLIAPALAGGTGQAESVSSNAEFLTAFTDEPMEDEEPIVDAAVITEFEVITHSGPLFEFRGTVVGGNGVVTITLDGEPYSIFAIQIQVDSNGRFSHVMSLSGGPEDDGEVYVVAVDSVGRISNVKYAWVHQPGL